MFQTEPPLTALDGKKIMANPVVRAFNLALAGDAKELGAMLTAKDVDASAAREDGMYRGWTLLHAAAGKNHEAAVEREWTVHEEHSRGP